MIDLDSDGVEDAFENIFLGTTEFAFWDDADGDGFSVGEEFQAGHRSGRSALHTQRRPALPRDAVAAMDPAGTVTVSWSGNATATYVVQTGSSPDGWQDSPVAPVQVAPGEYEWSVPAPVPFPTRRFFRVGVSVN